LKLVFIDILLVGIPKVYYFGEEGGSYIIVMELLADNVEDIFTKQNKRQFTLMTALLLVI
jgi:hypothetical protein